MIDGSIAPVAWAALVLSVPAAVLLVAWLSARLSVALVLLGGALLLPARVTLDLPGIPPLDRESVSCLTALAAVLLLRRSELGGTRPGMGAEAWVWLLVAGALLSCLANSDPVQAGPTVLPGTTLYDGFSLASHRVMRVWIPFFLGRALYRRANDLAGLFATIVLFMTVYSLGIVYELWMSPQLHRIVYGFHPHEFAQAVRGGGWRPVVFTVHGLSLAQFVLFAVLGAVGLARAQLRVLGFQAGYPAAYLSMLLLAMKSLAATLYGAATAPLIVLLRPRRQLQIACLALLPVFAYPALQVAGWIPRQALLEAAATLSEERAASLRFRFDQETALLARARERLVLGWGSFGRNRIYDPMTGKDQSITDGFWIIVLGEQGVLGFAAAFGLLLTPVLLAARRIGAVKKRRERILLATLVWLVVVSGINLLPNAELNPFVLFLGGALAGVTRSDRRTRRPPASAAYRMRGAEPSTGSP